MIDTFIKNILLDGRVHVPPEGESGLSHVRQSVLVPPLQVLQVISHLAQDPLVLPL